MSGFANNELFHQTSDVHKCYKWYRHTKTNTSAVNYSLIGCKSLFLHVSNKTFCNKRTKNNLINTLEKISHKFYVRVLAQNSLG